MNSPSPISQQLCKFVLSVSTMPFLAISAVQESPACFVLMLAFAYLTDIVFEL